MTHIDMPPAWLEAAVDAARAAGEAILAIYATDFAVQSKADASPVTLADERAEKIIVPRLRALDPSIPIVAEEAVAAGRMPRIDADFWLVDPLDGTREFVQRNGEFTVNIALIRDRQPVLGVVLAPALGAGRLFAGVVGHGAWQDDGGGRRAIRCRELPAAGATVVASRSHGDSAATDAWLRTLDVRVDKLVTAGSSLKFCLLAAGEADLYPRFGRTMEWDVAAGHAVLRAAGGDVVDMNGSPLAYGKPGLENPHFVARSRS